MIRKIQAMLHILNASMKLPKFISYLSYNCREDKKTNKFQPNHNET